jgi:DNA-directed RNA polymerase specialized sigma24 family protein
MGTGAETGGQAKTSRVQERGWLAAIAAGGPAGHAAMKALHLRYQRDFRAFLRHRGFGDADIDDITQRVWLDVARKAPTFVDTGVPEAWLWGFLKNEMHDELRRNARAASRFSPANDDATRTGAGDTITMASPGPTPEKAMSLRDLRDCVERAFVAFKRQQPHEAWWMYLRHVEDWDLDQVAHHRGGTKRAAAEFLSRARKLFRDHVAPCLELRRD